MHSTFISDRAGNNNHTIVKKSEHGTAPPASKFSQSTQIVTGAASTVSSITGATSLAIIRHQQQNKTPTARNEARIEAKLSNNRELLGKYIITQKHELLPRPGYTTSST